MTATPPKPLHVGLLLFDGMTQLDATGPYEVFGRMPGTRVSLVASSVRAIKSDLGLAIMAEQAMSDAPQFDIVCVPGGAGASVLMEDAPTLEFLRAQARGARYMTAVCTGALVLGAAGLLRGYRATTHWLSIDLLGMFGAMPVSERVVIDRNRITGGGVTAGIDFALHIASLLFGAQTAKELQLAIEYNPSPPFAGGSPSVASRQTVDAVTLRTVKMRAHTTGIALRASKRLTGEL